MNVLLIQQDMGIREAKIPIFPIGLTYIAAELQAHRVKIFDPNLYPLELAFEELKQEVLRFKPDIVGVSIRNIDTTNFRNLHVHFKTVRPTIQLIKSLDPTIKIMVGGPGFSLFPEQIMRRVPEIDFGVYLEGEETTSELLANLDQPHHVPGIFFRQGQEVIFTGKRALPDFANMPTPVLDPAVINVKNYLGPSYNIIGIQTKRGCLLQCGYCSYPFLNGKTLRMREPVQVVDQIEYMIMQYGMERFVFTDSVFNVPTEHAAAICREMIRRSLNVEFGVWLHMKGLTEELLSLLHEAGAVQIDFSPDAATNKGLQALRKGLTEEDIARTIRMVKHFKGIGFGFGFFTSLPGYTFSDMLKTLCMPFKIQFALPGRGGGGVTYIRIEPDTLIRDIAVQEGLISADDDLFPEKEEDLQRMFYRPTSQKWGNAFIDSFFYVYEHIMKPTAIFAFKTLARLQGKRSVYDQKVGIADRPRRERGMRLKGRLKFLIAKSGVRFFWGPFRHLVKVLPVNVIYLLATMVARGLYPAIKHSLILTGERLYQARQISYIRLQLEKIAFSSFELYVKRHFENLFMGTLTAETSKRRIHITGLEHLDHALAQGNGAIIQLAHFGSFLLILPALGFRGYQVNQLVGDPQKALEHSIHKYKHSAQVEEYRNLPVNFLHVEKSVRPIVNALKNNELVAIALDGRDGHEWVTVPFLGRKANLSPGSLRFASMTGAAILPTFIVRNADDTHTISIEAPFVPVPYEDKHEFRTKNMEKLAQLFEDYIMRYPDHFLMTLHEHYKRARQGVINMPLFPDDKEQA